MLSILKNSSMGMITVLVLTAIISGCASSGAEKTIPTQPASHQKTNWVKNETAEELSQSVVNYLNGNNIGYLELFIIKSVSSPTIKVLNVLKDHSDNVEWSLHQCRTPEVSTYQVCTIQSSNWSMAPVELYVFQNSDEFLIYDLMNLNTAYSIRNRSQKSNHKANMVLRYFGHMNSAKWNLAEKALDDLYQRIGTSSFARYQRSEVLYRQDRYSEALPLALTLVKEHPENEHGYWQAVVILLAMENYEDASVMTQLVADRFDYPLTKEFMGEVLEDSDIKNSKVFLASGEFNALIK